MMKKTIALYALVGFTIGFIGTNLFDDFKKIKLRKQINKETKEFNRTLAQNVVIMADLLHSK